MKTTILPDGSAFSTAVVLSKEEIEKLPLKERPISARLSSKMYHDTWEAIGAASMTFNTAAGNEVFNTEQASKICIELLFKIANEVESAKLDAMKEGMRRAAEKCKQRRDAWKDVKTTATYSDGCSNDWSTILTAAEQLTEKDL